MLTHSSALSRYNIAMISNERMNELRETFRNRGATEAIAMLNSMTECRFTSLYQFFGDKLHNLTFFDRQDPSAGVLDDIPIDVSYCVFIRDTDRPFCLEDSLHDSRTTDHPKRQEIRSYFGVPLQDGHGNTIGTLCHFDFQPKEISDEVIAVTEEFASFVGPQIPDDRTVLAK